MLVSKSFNRVFFTWLFCFYSFCFVSGIFSFQLPEQIMIPQSKKDAFEPLYVKPGRCIPANSPEVSSLVCPSDLEQIAALRDQHFPSNVLQVALVGGVAIALFGVAVFGMLTERFWMLVFDVAGIMLLSAFDIWTAHMRNAKTAGFLQDLYQLNASFRALNKPFQVFSQSGETFKIERCHEDCDLYLLQLVGGDASGLLVLSPQFSLNVEKWCGREYADHEFPMEVEELNTVLRARRMTSLLWFVLQIVCLLAFVGGGTALWLFLDVPVVGTVLASFGLGFLAWGIIGHLVFRAARENRADFKRVFDELRMRHVDEKAWEWSYVDLRATNAIYSVMMTILEHLMPLNFAPVVGITKRSGLSQNLEISVDSETTSLL